MDSSWLVLATIVAILGLMTLVTWITQIVAYMIVFFIEPVESPQLDRINALLR